MASTQDSQPFHWHYAELEDHDFQIRGRTLFFVIVLFAIVLIFTLIFVYARWLCSFHRDSTTTTTTTSSDPTSHAPPPPPPQSRGLDPATINALPITMVTRGAGGKGRPLESECCICLGVFEDGEKVKVLPSCNHPYHSDCVDRWLSAESSCPLCRASLRVESELHRLPVIVTQ